MSRRIDVELTSQREDGSFTWRAAGAREPKGVVQGDQLPAASRVGAVFRVEVELTLDGMEITQVIPAKGARTEAERLELLGGRRDVPLVTSTVSERGRGDRPGRGGEGGSGERRDRGPRPDRGDRPRREGGPRGQRPDGERSSRPSFDSGPPPETRPKAKRLRPGRKHRSDLIAGLPEEQRPVAEELQKGGMAGVRLALEQQNEKAAAEGHPAIDPAPLLALAESIWPRMRSAEWRDRAEAALVDIEELDLRDLRSVVVAADGGARDDDTRELAAQLRGALTFRVDSEHNAWLDELQELITDGRVVAALRRSSRPPKAGSPLPNGLAQSLTEKAGEALTAEATSERWAIVLDALAFSPVRTAVNPASVPTTVNDELITAVRKSSQRLPHIAVLFGIEPTAAPAAPTSRRGGRTRPERRSPGLTPKADTAPKAGTAPKTDTAPTEATEDAVIATVEEVIVEEVIVEEVIVVDHVVEELVVIDVVQAAVVDVVEGS